ncbi:hypothetical protein EDEG_02248 [Edhazardia aedis USNM 41457]|uniref:Uncharacterized protein n=1 Tax=Edhazardia aedis (strain USNM 41457) TaxID=1003232 RepID=J9D6G3_EDHAE|nr:hypothetical protein EDEG_02248 [Edhazardia aedis USNM 41457]|eukprot:EJW03391.1 hypothetical protein EDEG_02248 [Edhazardia aedis USNM 41457]
MCASIGKKKIFIFCIKVTIFLLLLFLVAALVYSQIITRNNEKQLNAAIEQSFIWLKQKKNSSDFLNSIISHNQSQKIYIKLQFFEKLQKIGIQLLEIPNKNLEQSAEKIMNIKPGKEISDTKMIQEINNLNKITVKYLWLVTLDNRSSIYTKSKDGYMKKIINFFFSPKSCSNREFG